ncbi:MAG: hypothetical protein QMD46_09915 [Methanomicrobiales archaeon]|nr:hypothetical protein [Methanomicrobiales archaeon]MDI6876782.1 hypothetical protein [Methanomicrobiales archaeon]
MPPIEENGAGFLQEGSLHGPNGGWFIYLLRRMAVFLQKVQRSGSAGP